MWRFLRREVPRTAVRISAALILYWLAGKIAWPPEVGRWVGVLSFAALAAVILLLCGKLLYDSLFYERYWRQVDSR